MNNLGGWSESKQVNGFTIFGVLVHKQISMSQTCLGLR